MSKAPTTDPRVLVALLALVGALTVARDLLQILDRLRFERELEEGPGSLHDEIDEFLGGTGGETE